LNDIAGQSGVDSVIKKNWTDLEGKPTQDDSVSHFDKDGFLDIREQVDEDIDQEVRVKMPHRIVDTITPDNMKNSSEIQSPNDENTVIH